MTTNGLERLRWYTCLRTPISEHFHTTTVKWHTTVRGIYAAATGGGDKFHSQWGGDLRVVCVVCLCGLSCCSKHKKHTWSHALVTHIITPKTHPWSPAPKTHPWSPTHTHTGKLYHRLIAVLLPVGGTRNPVTVLKDLLRRCLNTTRRSKYLSNSITSAVSQHASCTNTSE